MRSGRVRAVYLGIARAEVALGLGRGSLSPAPPPPPSPFFLLLIQSSRLHDHVPACRRLSFSGAIQKHARTGQALSHPPQGRERQPQWRPDVGGSL